MPKPQNLLIAGLLILLGVTPVGAGGPPPNPTPSDSLGNTAGGTDALFNLTTGESNTAFGFEALQSNQSGSQNTAFGADALLNNTTGIQNAALGANAMYGAPGSSASQNTALGADALEAINTGSSNTASGFQALLADTSGSWNTATGMSALQSNLTGDYNTATGAFALRSNTAPNNTATGAYAMYGNTTGFDDTSTGYAALAGNNTGSFNTADGEIALWGNTSGAYNTSVGRGSLYYNSTGNNNTAVGAPALQYNTTGSNNIALGNGSGQSLTTGSYNIDIGNSGLAAENSTIRIGTAGVQKSTYIAGISGLGVIGDSVLVSKAGQLGIVVSSARFKRDISDMGTASAALLKLRPVTFQYRNDETGTLQYGLIAEEVAQVYPELVSYGPDGKPLTVRYSILSSMLLNELQKHVSESQRLAAQVSGLSAQMTALRTSTGREIAELKISGERDFRSMQERMVALEQAMKARTGNEKLATAQ